MVRARRGPRGHGGLRHGRPGPGPVRPIFEHAAITEDVRGPLLALLLATAVLVAVLVRWPHGRDAAFLLALLVMVPVFARWSDPAAVLLAGGPLFVVGYVIGARRARRPA